jgi:hypothetical protein
MNYGVVGISVGAGIIGYLQNRTRCNDILSNICETIDFMLLQYWIERVPCANGLIIIIDY